MRSLVILLTLSACGGGGAGDGTPTVEAADPPFGPIAGGAKIVLTGSGFLFGGAAPNHVVVGGREAPLAAAIDDQTLEVELPPGEPGPVDIVVFNRNGTVTAPGVFHYSTPPEVTDVTPGNVVFDSVDTKVTITGTGFQDENAGTPRVLVDGRPQVDVEVLSDTQLTFTALSGQPLALTTLEVVNERGTGVREHAFRYAPAASPGLLVFPREQGQGGTFAFYVDPTNGSTVTIAHTALGNGIGRTRSVYIDADGEYFAFDSQRRFGRIDAVRQDLTDTVATEFQSVGTMGRRGDDVFVLVRLADQTKQWGRFDPVDLSFQPIGAALPQFSTVALDDNKAFASEAVQNNHTLFDFNLATAERTNPRAITGLTPNTRIRTMRIFNGQLFALLHNGDLFRVNTTTGGTTPVASLGVSATAMEVLP